MIPVIIAAKIIKGHTLILSAQAPETIEIAVAQNTIWKNQSDATE
jgi:hypothetical protein